MDDPPVHRHFDMRWPDFATLVKSIDFAILPIGALEAHGPHLPMGTDVIIAEYLAEKLARSTGGLLLQSLCFTPAFSLRLFPGTVGVTDETFGAELVEIAESLYQHGIRTIYLVVCHLGAAEACRSAERRLLLTSRARIVNLVLPGLSEAMQKHCQSRRWHSTYLHAEEFETSAILAIRPDLVDMKKALRDYPEVDPLFGTISIPWNEFSQTGVVGDATVATAETGHAILESIVRTSLDLIGRHRESSKEDH